MAPWCTNLKRRFVVGIGVVLAPGERGESAKFAESVESEPMGAVGHDLSDSMTESPTRHVGLQSEANLGAFLRPPIF